MTIARKQLEYFAISHGDLGIQERFFVLIFLEILQFESKFKLIQRELSNVSCLFLHSQKIFFLPFRF